MIQAQLLQAGADGVLAAPARHATGMVDLTNDEYHSGPGISKSHLDSIAEQSPLHYWFKYINPQRERQPPTKSMDLGTAIHSAILEPDLFTSQFVVEPEDAPKRPTKRQLEAKKPSGDTMLAIDFWKGFDKAHEHQSIVTVDDYRTCLAIRDRVHNHPKVAGLFQGGRSEVSVYAYLPVEVIDPNSGEIIEGEELVKCRFDYLHASGALAVDLKSTDDASKAGFAKSIANYRYMLQPPWYFDVTKAAFGECPENWAFVAVETSPPYAIGVYYPTPDDMERGRIAARKHFEKIVLYKHLNFWPDYAELEGPQPIIMPGWAKF